MSKSTFLAGLHAGFGLPQAVVVGLVERATADDVVAIRRVARGYDNEVYEARIAGGSTVYARIRRPGEGDFASEAWAMEQARAVGVPVPDVLAIEVVATEEGDRSAMVITQAPGRQLEAHLPSLSGAERRAAMVDVGRTLAAVHSVRTAGLWRPDDDGAWADPDELRRGWIADRAAERGHLVAAGLDAEEVERTLELLGASPDTPAQVVDPVLCHGDVSPEHVFVGPDLRVSGLIDWGMWHGGSPIGDLAYVAMCHEDADLAAIVEGHGDSLDDPAVRGAIYLSAVNLVIGHIAHHVGIDDPEGSAHNVAALRHALAQLTDEPIDPTGPHLPHTDPAR